MQTHGASTVIDGRYELERELGRGPTGMVWCARDTLLGRRVALKLVHPSLADDVRFTSVLAEQVRRLASLDAPGLVRLFDTGEEDVPFLVHRYLEGESLREIVSRTGPVHPATAVRWVRDTLVAIAPAHDAGLLHLHLTLDDVIVGPDGEVMVTDLAVGPAIVASRAPEELERYLGPGVAPELTDGAAPDARSDVWGAGAIAFELITGERPNGTRSVRERRPDVPRRLDRAIARALEPDPNGRFADVRAFADALAMPEGDATTAMPRRGDLRTWLTVPLIVLVGVIAAIAIGLWVGRLEVGGPIGIRAVDQPEPSPSAPTAGVPDTSVRPLSAVAFDPLGDGTENSSNAELAIDGDDATAWQTEGYRYPNGELGKDGVGIVFDLGRTRAVTGFKLTSTLPGATFRVAVGDDAGALLDAVGDELTMQPAMRVRLDARGRLVLVWITSVVPSSDGYRAAVGEFRALVADDA